VISATGNNPGSLFLFWSEANRLESRQPPSIWLIHRSKPDLQEIMEPFAPHFMNLHKSNRSHKKRKDL